MLFAGALARPTSYTSNWENTGIVTVIVMLLRELWLDPHHILVTEKIQEDNIKERFLRGAWARPLYPGYSTKL